MGGGGKSQTSTQQVSIPPEVLARYNAVNARAEDVAKQGFQKYGTTAEAFVAPLTQAQQQGIQQTQQYAQTAQPYFGAATDQLMAAQQQGQAGLAGAYPLMQQGLQAGQQLGGEAYGGYQSMLPSFLPAYGQAQQGIQQGLGAGQALLGGGLGYTLAGAQGISPQQFSGQAINQYMSPFMGNVVQQTMAAQAQQNAQQRRALTGEAIRAGAFGGDRAGIAQANLAYQQNLANQQTLANLLQGGYGQALGAFQQQQGVNLAAEQANRAALQQTGQSLAGLGQQAFGMGTGAAQQQAALGQALAGLYGQQAQGLQGLSQQQFGQGLTAAQQQAQLAQQGYGMGAGTAQALAGLGQGAQAAGLQGAQAQLGAGQIQQQTEQAGKQALYNQFLQQQGYPFQVAQFLANIAMGTGALSGSTTTTTQPSAFFSDRKMKEGIRKIGETKDGLPIYKFRYKGEDKEQTHIGYMADEVEKKHPDAVGEYGGAKYVDYGKVNARESMGGAVRDGGLGRGAYAYGGADHVDPNDLQALIAQQRQMYGPHGMGGLYGTSPQQTPGGKSPVPAGGLHVGKLATAGAPPRQREGGLRSAMGSAQEAKQTAEMVFGRYNPQTKKHEGSLFDQAKSAYQSFAGDDKAAPAAAAAKPEMSDLDKESLKMGLFAQGGLVPRQHFKFGGEDMYKADTSYVPEEVLESDDKKPELMTAKGGSGGGGGGGKSGLGTAVGVAGTLANFIPGVGPFIGTALKGASMFMADGGVVPRHGYATDGAVEEAPKYGIDDYLNALKRIESSGNYEALGPVTKSGDRAYGAYQVMGRNVPEWTERHLGQRMSPEQFLKDQKAQDAVARAEFGGYLDKYGRPEDAASMWFSGRPMAEAGQRADITGTTVPAYVQRFQKALGMPVEEGGRGQQVASAQTTGAAPAGGEKGGIGDFLTSSRFLAPLGTGLLTMASSPSRYLGAAALQGLGAGLAAMQPAEEREAEIAKKREEVGTQQTITARNTLLLAQTARYTDSSGRAMIMTENGPMEESVWKSLPPDRQPKPLGYDQAVSAIKRLPAGEVKYGPVYGPYQPGAPAGGPKPAGTAGQPGQPGQPAEAKPGEPAAPGAAPQKPFTMVGSAGQDQVQKDFQNFVINAPGMAEQKAESNKLESQMIAAAQASAEAGNNLNQLTSLILTVPEQGWTKAGPTNEVRVKVANYFNDLLGVAGLDDKYKILPQDVGTNLAIAKLNNIAAFQQERGAGQRSFGALEIARQTVPNMNLPREAILDILAEQYVNKQQALDQRRYLNEYKQGLADKGPMSQYYLTQNAIDAMRKDRPSGYYGEEKAKIKQLLKSYRIDEKGNRVPVFNEFFGPNRRPGTYIDRLYNTPGLSRYVENN